MIVTEIESFVCKVPVGEKAAAHGVRPEIGVTRVKTDAGIIGYEFYTTPARYLELARRLVVGQDPHHVERFLKEGLERCPAVETALWDIIGKAAGAPIKNLMGGDKDRIACYLTCVWSGPADQSGVTYETQAQHLKYYQDHGFKAAKIRSFRRPITADADAVATIRDQVGGRDQFQIMIDRTGQYSGTVWTLDEAIIMARRYEDVEVTWLEEPMVRGDVYDHARLRASVDMLITGGEGDRGLSPFARYLAEGSFDIVQPEPRNCGGLLMTKKIAAMAEGFGIDCVPHGTHGLMLAARLQIEAALPNCWIEEVALVNPPLLPWEQWEHCLALVNQKELFEVEDGDLIIPDRPGIGIDVNDAAIDRYRAS
jgi:D-galactarolactone cycloisomerase